MNAQRTLKATETAPLLKRLRSGERLMAESKRRPARGAHYQLQDGALVRDREFCPKCGPGTFLAVHADRTSCGRYGYTEFNR